MDRVNRRTVLGGLVAAAISPTIAWCGPGAETFEVASDEGQVVLARYAANRTGKRPRMKDLRTRDEARVAYEIERYPAWAARVSSTITAILARGDSSDRLGLLGFSLGGFVAATTAARDSRISALAVLYGGMPDNIASQVKHMPAVLELHGDADRNVSLASGEALVALAKSVGAPAEQIKYPGKGHGFDFADNDPATVDAVERVSRFFELRIGSA